MLEHTHLAYNYIGCGLSSHEAMTSEVVDRLEALKINQSEGQVSLSPSDDDQLVGGSHREVQAHRTSTPTTSASGAVAHSPSYEEQQSMERSRVVHQLRDMIMAQLFESLDIAEKFADDAELKDVEQVANLVQDGLMDSCGDSERNMFKTLRPYFTNVGNRKAQAFVLWVYGQLKSALGDSTSPTLHSSPLAVGNALSPPPAPPRRSRSRSRNCDRINERELPSTQHIASGRVNEAMTYGERKLSKAMCKVLRHCAPEFHIVLSSDGFCPLVDLQGVLHRYSFDEIRRVVRKSRGRDGGPRFQLVHVDRDGKEFVRAVEGHSLDYADGPDMAHCGRIRRR